MESDIKKTRNWDAKKAEIEKQARSTRHARSPRSIKGNRSDRFASCIRR